jgi:prepilin signal peptidase PulO-like enzyme (type II secretory pathway)
MGGECSLTISQETVFVVAFFGCILGWILASSGTVSMIPYALINALGVSQLGPRTIPLAFLFGYASSSDLRTMEVPNWIFSIGFLCWCLMGGAVSRTIGILSSMVALVTGILLQQISRVYFGDVAYGGADVKLGCLFALYTGVETLFPGLALGSILALSSTAIAVYKKKLTLRDAIPFIPALSSGFMGAIILLKIHYQ